MNRRAVKREGEGGRGEWEKVDKGKDERATLFTPTGTIPSLTLRRKALASELSGDYNLKDCVLNLPAGCMKRPKSSPQSRRPSGPVSLLQT